MLMNGDDNQVKYTKSPLKTDESGRFSRKGEKINPISVYYPIFDSIFVVLFSFFLIAVDFILFAGSGNIQIFNNSIFPVPEVMFILGVLLVIVASLTLLVHKFVYLKSAIAAFFAFMFVFAVYKQFSQLNQSIGSGSGSISVSIVFGLVFAAVTFSVYSQNKIIYKIFLTLVPIILFFNVCSSFDRKEINEFVTTIEDNNTEAYGKDERLIYFILPHYIGINQIQSWNTEEAYKTYNLVNGFYQKNKFHVFDNAYVETVDYFDNLVMFLNPRAKKNTVKKYIMNTKLLSGHWKFSNIINNNINLKDNELYDYLNYQGFNISAYKSRNIDLCRKNHQLNVHRCVEKVNLPTNIYEMNLPFLSRSNVLFMEWFFSLKLGKDILSPVVSGFSSNNPSQINLMYNSLYVVNSIKFFDILAENIKEDSGKQAYFVFADIPSDMYIYDEFCQIKEKDKWIDRANPEGVIKDYTDERREAYILQYRCLYGKLQEFMNKLNDDGILYNTKIVLTGASNLNNFRNDVTSDYIDNFLRNSLVNMAVFNGSRPEFKKNGAICPVRTIMTQQIFGFGKCSELDNLHEQTLLGLKQTIYNLSKKDEEDNREEFENWYEMWKLKNE